MESLRKSIALKQKALPSVRKSVNVKPDELTQTISLNVIPFTPQVTEKEFAFYNKKGEGLYPIKWKALFQIMPEWMEKNKQHLYTDFQEPKPGAVVTAKIDLAKHYHFAQHYFRYLILQYFKTKADVVFPNFTNDIEVWFHDEDLDAAKYKVYQNFTIKVQYARVSDTFELVVSYDGTSKILKKSLKELVDFPQDKYNWINCNGILKRFKKMTPDDKQHMENLFPVLSNPMKPLLGIPSDKPIFENRYPEYFERINEFHDSFINTPDFQTATGITVNGFHEVPDDKVIKVHHTSNRMIFGNNVTDINAQKGMINNGPYRPSPHNKVRLFFIYPASERKELVEKFYKYLKEGFFGRDFNGNLKQLFPNLTDYIHQPFEMDPKDSIAFTSTATAFQEIKTAIGNKTLHPDTRYLAVYFSPVPKTEKDDALHGIYYKVKELLLDHGVTSQVIYKENIANKSFNYFLPNIEVAMCAKLDGIPWRLNRTTANELIVGVGAFYNHTHKTKYVGSTFCFNNEGSFQEFDCFRADETDMLAGSIRKAVMHYVVENENVSRLIIHFYKKISEKELKPILQILRKLNLDIPVIIVTINKTESKELLAFDTEDSNLMPISGTMVQTGFREYLMFNNIRYTNFSTLKGKDYHFPIKVSLFCDKKDVLTDVLVVKELLDQVYQFSRMYWKSISQQNLPVTIKYPEMVAEIYPYFEHDKLPDFGKKNLWFL